MWLMVLMQMLFGTRKDPEQFNHAVQPTFAAAPLPKGKSYWVERIEKLSARIQALKEDK
jgi:hypothetical protein